ncbi:vWA domain-containing protein [Halioxenophilus sp. WMMB6]|uniref:vWA domain-containing protein n=1 Tax=Halioxenophilus sp. WMMB6 TaxID=3073815 RepID=UPI00295EB133|nr:VWA domain-containing protein [Halioxenophilus sp. WMMB6]
MDKPLVDFIQALRHHGLPISPAETLDALNAAALLGVAERERLRAALGLTLAKTVAHRGVLEQLFDQFFGLETASDASANAATNSPAPNLTGAIPPERINAPLGQLLLKNSLAEQQRLMVTAAEAAGAQEMKLFLQKSRVSSKILLAMGDRELQLELQGLQAEGQQLALVVELQTRRQQLLDRIKDYVEQQYFLYSSGRGQQLTEATLYSAKLSHAEQVDQLQLKRLVQKIAKKLASLHSRRRRVHQRGLLDVRKTIAANAAFDGYLFHTRWKSTRIDRPKVMVICDVSGSVAAYARFLLLFVYSLQEVLPRVRSFVFSNQLAEVSNCFRDMSADAALAMISERWGNGSTDYGRALVEFSDIALADIDHKTQVIMLGDARNNYDDGHSEIWQTIYSRAQRVLWLNPEERSRWNSGDSIMASYAPYCSLLEPCNTLRDMERILGRLLKYSA